VCGVTEVSPGREDPGRSVPRGEVCSEARILHPAVYPHHPSNELFTIPASV